MNGLNNLETVIKQFAKNCKLNYLPFFYSYIYSVLNNLINTNIPKNLKFIFIQFLMFERVAIFFKDDDGDLQIGRFTFCDSYDENFMPIDITASTLNGKQYHLIKGNYVMMYNPIPVDYLNMKLDEIAKLEKIINYRRKLYKVPYIFECNDSKTVKSAKNFTESSFSYEKLINIIQSGTIDVKQCLHKIDLDVEYITDKLLDENESIKEDILEILGIYKNTSTNRERVNEQELIIANSLTTVNKLGLEDSLNDLFKDIKDVLNFDYKVELNINKIFDSMKSKKGGEE